MRNIGANEQRKSALALTMKDQEVTILMNDLQVLRQKSQQLRR
jgi:hypothetical protein